MCLTFSFICLAISSCTQQAASELRLNSTIESLTLAILYFSTFCEGNQMELSNRYRYIHNNFLSARQIIKVVILEYNDDYATVGLLLFTSISLSKEWFLKSTLSNLNFLQVCIITFFVCEYYHLINCIIYGCVYLSLWRRVAPMNH